MTMLDNALISANDQGPAAAVCPRRPGPASRGFLLFRAFARQRHRTAHRLAWGSLGAAPAEGTVMTGYTLDLAPSRDLRAFSLELPWPG